VRLEEAGEIRGSVLDVGCGTGEHVLYLASRGHDAWGVDLAPLAIDIARRNSAERNIQATFIVADVFDLGTLRRTFDTVVDSGLLHIFPPEQRPGLGICYRWSKNFVYAACWRPRAADRWSRAVSTSR
jgi:2-polyprenyl-3-methyl-5-hydroxy-6-metoxy-1,4-benzoquinol methylase